MPGPTLTFGFVIATLLGAGFHFVMGGDARRLGLYLLAGWIGFAFGHLLGASIELRIFDIGALHFLSAVVGAIISLVLSRLLIPNRS